MCTVYRVEHAGCCIDGVEWSQVSLSGACCTCRSAPALRFRSQRYAHWRETCAYLSSGPPHSHRTATIPAHPPHCRECAGPVTSIWLSDALQRKKRYAQDRDARHHAAPSKRIRLRVESGRASLPEAFGCIARQGPMLRIDSHRRTVNLTTRPTRRAWMRLPAQEVGALFDSWLRAARVKL